MSRAFGHRPVMALGLTQVASHCNIYVALHNEQNEQPRVRCGLDPVRGLGGQLFSSQAFSSQAASPQVLSPRALSPRVFGASGGTAILAAAVPISFACSPKA